MGRGARKGRITILFADYPKNTIKIKFLTDGRLISYIVCSLPRRHEKIECHSLRIPPFSINVISCKRKERGN